MNLHSYRFGKGDDSTLSTLFVEDVFECFILEDELRRVKIRGETAIPAGRYEIKLRTNSARFEKKYSRRFPGLHEGMLWLQDVPNFTDVYIHIGNDDGDTDGCPLTGEVPQVYPDGEFTVGRSTAAYKRLYKKVIAALHRNERVFIHIYDDPKHVVEGL